MKKLNGILLLYYHPPVTYAPTVMEHVNAFTQYSQFKVWAVNTQFGYPKTLDNLQFNIIVLHYSMFGSANYIISPPFYQLLERHANAYKIWICQDECYNFRQREQFANRHKIDCIYSILQPKYFDEVYYSRCPSVKKVCHTLTGYVGESMVKKASQFAKLYEQRTVDIGYRARPTPTYLGLGGLEKMDIAQKFQQHTNGLNLHLDIKFREADRLYGDHYWRWLGNLKAILGVESGGSIFDLENEVWDEYHRRLGRKANIRNYVLPYDKMPPELMKKWENKIPYRAISPRYFEAAAFRICQVLYPGEYNGILKPWVHYLPLERDFKNFHQIIKLMRSAKGQDVIGNAHRDLIESGKYTFQKFIGAFDEELIKSGLNPRIERTEATLVTNALNTDLGKQKWKHLIETLIYAPYYNKWPGKQLLMPIAQPIGQIYFKLKGYKKGV